MYKAYVYHSFEEKEALAKELLAEIPLKKRKALSKALMDFFYRPVIEDDSDIYHPLKINKNDLAKNAANMRVENRCTELNNARKDVEPH